MTDFVFFWKISDPNGWLSNWSSHEIIDEDGNRFKTVEHYVMFQKAKLMNDFPSMSMIANANSPEEAKKLGRRVKNWNEKKWVSNRENIMYHALELKLISHPHLKQLLLNTTGMIIAEASPFDTIWGIGLAKTDKNATWPEFWPGKNLLGKLWMRLREINLD